MSCSRLSHRPPRPFGVCRVLPALFVVAGLGIASASAAESGTAYSHPIELEAGDFVRAVVEQRADVRVELLDPEGREVLHVDGPHAKREDEEIAAIAERAGLYQLRVLSCPESAPAADCYTLHLDPPRPATDADRRRAEAVRTTQQAADAMFIKTEESLRFQLAARERALWLWAGLGECRREAEELHQLGIVHRLLRQPDEAARRLHRAVEAWAALGDAALEAEALNEAGRACEAAGQLEDAWKDYRQALAKAQTAGDRGLQKDILNNMGLLLNVRGEHREAVAHLNQGLALSRELGGSDQANILNSLGLAYSDLGETQEAIKLFKQALDLADVTPSDKAAAYNNLGTVHATLGNWEQAIECFDQALVLNRQQKDDYLLASTLNNLGLAQHYSGNLQAALASYQEALDLARETNNLNVQIQSAHNFGLLLDQKLGKTDEALVQWREVIRLAADHPVLDQVGLAARAAVEKGEGKLAASRATYMEAIARSRQKAELRFAADLTLQLARVERGLGDLAGAVRHVHEAVESIESQRNRVVSLDQRALFLASNQSFYEFYIHVLMELDRRSPGAGHDLRALTVSEQARARSLLDLLGEADSGLRRGVPRDVLDREKSARAKLRDLDLLYMGLVHENASAERIAQAAEQLRKAAEELEDVEGALRASSGSYAALTTQPLDVQAIQSQVLGDRTLLLEYALGEERSYLWAVTSTAVHSFELPGRQKIEAEALDFYNAVTARNASDAAEDWAASDILAERAGLALSQTILKPVEPLLGNRILLVVGDGVLQYVPFTALPLPSAPTRRVLENNQFVSLPSASTLAALRQQIEGRPSAPKTLAVLANPVFAGDPRLRQARNLDDVRGTGPVHRGLPPRGPDRQADQLRLAPLPFSAEEARNILALVPEAGQRLAALDFDASYELAVSGQLAEYRYVHFATHGLIDSEQPKLSKLALSQYRKDGMLRKEGFLRLDDIYNLDLNADLVVLSACRTALGKEVRGEGLVGLTRGFMYAGAARVLASLWSVEDRATAELMQTFYRHLLAGKRPADALREAQLEMARKPQYRSPYYWAGFSLQGEWK